MANIGILAYGSLIKDPGLEIFPLIMERILEVETPFSIEFARSSKTRDGAPTVIPVEAGGAPVHSVILVLDSTVSLEKAEDLLWRRETRNEKPNMHYKRPRRLGINLIIIDRIHNFRGIATVLFTKLSPNIINPTPEKLSELAIESVKGKAGKICWDGISYLISLKKQNIKTPLMKEYEKAILLKVGAYDLEEARKIILRTNE